MGLPLAALLELLDDDSQAYAKALLSQAPPPPYSQYGTDGIRGMFDTTALGRAPIDTVHSVDERIADTSEGPLRVRCYRPSSDNGLPVVLYIHGGGFVVGTLDGVDDLCRLLSTEGECVVVSVEYRRAPEHVFPAASDDALGVYDWVRREAASLGGDADRIALAGDSAGGNLALSVCTALAEADRPMPTSLVLAYPATSDGHAGPSWDVYENAPVLCRQDALWFWSMYTEGTGAQHDPRAVPVLSTTLHRLPPMLIISAEVDVLRSDYEHFASLASLAGAEVDLRRYDGVLHGFFTEVGSIGTARRAVSEAADHLRACFTNASNS